MAARILDTEMKLLSSHHHKHFVVMPPASSVLTFHNFSSLNSLRYVKNHKIFGLGSSPLGLASNDGKVKRIGKRKLGIVASSSSNVAAPLWESWTPEKGSKAPSLSDVIWPSAGAFAAMAVLGKIDQILAPKGFSMTIAPLGAVCAVLFATPSSPGARRPQL